MISKPTTFVAICGRKQAGKDTAAAALVETFDFSRVALADPLKEMAVAIDPDIEVCAGRSLPWHCSLSAYVADYGWDVAKSEPSVRRFLQRLGTEGCRSVFGEDVWVNALFRRTNGMQRVVVPDVRFPNELRALEIEGALTIWVNRPGADDGDTHPSEKSLGPDDAMIVIDNDGTIENFQKKVLDEVARWL